MVACVVYGKHVFVFLLHNYTFCVFICINNHSLAPLISIGFQREGARAGRWQFPHSPFRLDALDLVDMRAWPFDIDLVIIYVYSIHWILAFLILCFVGYCFFF